MPPSRKPHPKDPIRNPTGMEIGGVDLPDDIFVGPGAFEALQSAEDDIDVVEVLPSAPSSSSGKV